MDNKVRLWDAGAKKVITQLNDEANSATFSPDGQLIADGGTDGVIRLSTARPARRCASFTAIPGKCTAPSLVLMEIISSASARTTRCVCGNRQRAKLVKVLRGHTAAVREVVFSPDKNHFATEAYDQKAMIWSLDSDAGKALTGLTGTKAALAFSPDGKLLATEGGPGTELGALPSGDYPATVWDVETGKMKFRLGGHQEYIASVSFSPDGNAIVTSSGDSTARLWTSDGQLVKELRGHTRPLTLALFSPDGKFVVTASADNTVRVWDSLDGKLITEFRGHSQAVNEVAFSADGQFIVTADDDQTARLWPFHPGEGGTSSTIESWEHSAAVTSIACSPNGSEVAATTRDGKLWLDGVGMQRSVPFMLSRRSKRESCECEVQSRRTIDRNHARFERSDLQTSMRCEVC